jgi:hypothetical protein
MKTYEKPMLEIAEQTAESVFMASGADANEGVSYNLYLKNSGTVDWKTSHYDISVTNNGDKEVVGWKFTLQTVSGTPVAAAKYPNPAYDVEVVGNQVVVKSGTSTPLKAGDSVGPYSFTVDYTSETLTLA